MRSAPLHAYALVAAMVVVAACRAPASPSVPLGQTFTLAPDATEVIEDAGLSVQFLGVSEDSRCPINAVCVWAGNATVQLRVRESRSSVDYELHTFESSRRSVRHGSFVIQLVNVSPIPFGGVPTPRADYRATLTVTN